MIDVELDNYINFMREKPFEWGKCDCVLFGCLWAKELTGIDPAQDSYGAYDDETTAYEHLKEKYGSISEGFDKHFPQVQPEFVQKGDIVLCDYLEQEFIGICGARGFVFFKAKPKGVFAKRGVKILKAWRLK